MSESKYIDQMKEIVDRLELHGSDSKALADSVVLDINTATTHKPFWQGSEGAHFLSRTDTQFASVPLREAMEQRGLSNRLLDSLCEGLPDGAYIAGGFMTSMMQDDKKAKDIDLFFRDAKAFKETVKLILNPPTEKEEPDLDLWGWRGYTLAPNTDPGVLKTDLGQMRYIQFVHPTRPTLQLIKLVWYESLEHVLDSFDITVAQFGTDGSRLVFHPLAPMDLARKRLVLHRMQFPASTLRRIIKYTQKGYYACPGSLERITSEMYAAIQQNPHLNTSEFVYID